MASDMRYFCAAMIGYSGVAIGFYIAKLRDTRWQTLILVFSAILISTMIIGILPSLANRKDEE